MNPHQYEKASDSSKNFFSLVTQNLESAFDKAVKVLQHESISTPTVEFPQPIHIEYLEGYGGHISFSCANVGCVVLTRYSNDSTYSVKYIASGDSVMVKDFEDLTAAMCYFVGLSTMALKLRRAILDTL